MNIPMTLGLRIPSGGSLALSLMEWIDPEPPYDSNRALKRWLLANPDKDLSLYPPLR